MHKVYLGLGANIGNREENIDKAVDMLGECVGEVLRRSSFFRSEPWGFKSDNEFVNICLLCLTPLTPRQVLEKTKEIERMLGRKEKSNDGVYHDRIIDIDILLYDDAHIDEPDLRIPHPFMKEREFVMKPLGEIL